MATKLVLVVIFVRKSPFFGDETRSRRLFGAGNAIFWRRNSFSSSLLGGKLHFLATRPVLVVIFVPETPLFGDETRSRRRFCAEISTFWRRDSFSSSLLGGKLHFLATTSLIVVFLRRKTSFFGDETRSRRRFETENAIFWRRNPFSSSFWGRKLHFLATKLVLVVVFVRKTHFFGDETLSRRRFCAENSLFWRRHSFSSSFWGRKRYFLATKLVLVVFLRPKMLFFGDETLSRRRFCAENSLFWRRNSFSSSFLCGNLLFLATKLVLVVFFVRKSPLFSDDTLSRRRFWTENPLFWRRHPFSSSLLDGKLTFLATTPFLVVVFVRKTHFFGDDTPYRRHFCAEISTFWRRDPFSSSFLCVNKYTNSRFSAFVCL